MLSKHPQSPPPPCFPTIIPPSIDIVEGLVAKAIRSFPSGSAPGPSLFRANHLKEAITCPSTECGSQFLKVLTSVVKLLAAGVAPHEVSPHLCGASLLAVKKKGGGHRPIAVGEVLHWLTSKCLSTVVRTEAIRILTPLQVGVGARRGCEAIIHSVVQTLEREDLAPDSRWVLLLDFSNAFNSVSRKCMFKEIRSRIPSLSRWVECCFGAQPILHFGHHTVLSCCEPILHFGHHTVPSCCEPILHFGHHTVPSCCGVQQGILWAPYVLLSRSSLL